MRLLNLQKNFISTVTEEDNSAIETMIGSGGISIDNLMNIYRGNYIGGLQKALHLTYPVIEKLVGNEFFSAMTHRFINKNKLLTGNLDDYGDEFAEFLKNFPPVKNLPYLPDVAELEWLFHKSSVADRDIRTHINLANIPQNKYLSLVFEFNQSVNLISSRYPIHLIWEMNQNETDEAKTLDISEESPAYILIHRPNARTEIITMPKTQYILLENLMDGSTLYEAFEAAILEDEEFDLSSALIKFISMGIFSGFSIN